MLSDRRQFYLLLRGLGLYLLIQAARDGVGQSLTDVNEGMCDETWTIFWFARLPSYWPAIVELAVGGYLLFDGYWVLNRVAPLLEGRCWGCSYDLSGVVGRCPECGLLGGHATAFQVGPAPVDPPWMRPAKWPLRVSLLIVMIFAIAFFSAQILKHTTLVSLGPDGMYQLEW
jgi:hypothetical protein